MRPTVRSEGVSTILKNFPDWPQDSLPGGETAGSRVKIEQDGMIEKKGKNRTRKKQERG